MLSVYFFVVLLAYSILSTYAYVDFGAQTLLSISFFDPTVRPHQLPTDLRQEILPSMITAVSPIITIAPNGSSDTSYSLHYHDLFKRTKEGRGIFKRGVFANDPPFATCRQCGGSSTAYSTTSTAICVTKTYHGVFQYPDPKATTNYCYDTNYLGALRPTAVNTGLPCCFTIPESCLRNATSTTSFTFSTGVFRPTSTTTSTLSLSNSTRPFSTAASSSSSSLTTPTSTSRRATSSISCSSSGRTSTSNTSSRSAVKSPVLPSESTSSLSTFSTVKVISGTTIILTTSSATSMLTATTGGIHTSSLDSTIPYASSILSSPSSLSARSKTSLTQSSSSPSSDATTMTTRATSYSIIVISSTIITITITSTTTNSPSIRSSNGGTTVQSTIAVITATPSTRSSVTSFPVTIAPNTLVGCGTASGSGYVNGSGTVYFGSFSSVVSSGTASGYALKVIGCGTLIATTGGFNGTATVIGCGYGSGSGHITGTGTVWPAQLGGLVSFVTSGTMHNVSGQFSGCGTVTGTGTFTATGAPAITLAPSTTRTRSTVEVYVSYCPDPAIAGGLTRLGTNSSTSEGSAGTYHSSNGHAVNLTDLVVPNEDDDDNDDDDNPLCKVCRNSVGICCPPTVSCEDESGKCPEVALRLSGNTINGYLIADVMNSTAPVSGRRKVRALPRRKTGDAGKAVAKRAGDGKEKKRRREKRQF